jgi:glyceraldehyde 3-phosphate dehydrogenase
MLSGREPGDVPWGDLGVDIVVEATARYRSRDELQKHIDAGAKRVVVCVPPKDQLDLTLVCGVNDDALKNEHKIVSVGSCTSNAATPLLKVVHETFGIKAAFISTVHAYTNDQRVADVPHDDLRRSRAAAENIIPTETRTALTITDAYPVLKGKIHATALKVPVADGSVADITLELETKASVAELNAAIYKATLGPLRGILHYSKDPIVSRDIVGLPYSGIHDSLAVMAMDSGLVKLLVWFDIGWGYAHRVLDVCERMVQLDLEGAP